MPNFQELSVLAKANYIVVWFNFLVNIISMLANFILIFIFSRPLLRKYSYSFYMRAKAINDIILLIWLAHDWLEYVLDLNLLNMNQFACAILTYSDYWTGTLGQCLLFLISLDRFVTVVYPNRFLVMRKRSFQAFLVLIAIIFSLLLNIMLAINAKLIEVTTNGNNSSTVIRTCFVDKDFKTKQTWISASIVLGFIQPASCFINWKLYRYIRESRNKVASHGHTQAQKVQRNDRKLTVVSVVQSAVALVCKNLGGVLLFVAVMFLDPANEMSWLIYSIGSIPYIFEAGSTFFINCFMNSIFYHELIRCFFRNYQQQESKSKQTPVIKDKIDLKQSNADSIPI